MLSSQGVSFSLTTSLGLVASTGTALVIALIRYVCSDMSDPGSLIPVPDRRAAARLHLAPPPPTAMLPVMQHIVYVALTGAFAVAVVGCAASRPQLPGQYGGRPIRVAAPHSRPVTDGDLAISRRYVETDDGRRYGLWDHDREQLVVPMVYAALQPARSDFAIAQRVAGPGQPWFRVDYEGNEAPIGEIDEIIWCEQPRAARRTVTALAVRRVSPERSTVILPTPPGRPQLRLENVAGNPTEVRERSITYLGGSRFIVRFDSPELGRYARIVDSDLGPITAPAHDYRVVPGRGEGEQTLIAVFEPPESSVRSTACERGHRAAAWLLNADGEPVPMPEGVVTGGWMRDEGNTLGKKAPLSLGIAWEIDGQVRWAPFTGRARLDEVMATRDSARFDHLHRRACYRRRADDEGALEVIWLWCGRDAATGLWELFDDDQRPWPGYVPAADPLAAGRFLYESDRGKVALAREERERRQREYERWVRQQEELQRAREAAQRARIAALKQAEADVEALLQRRELREAEQRAWNSGNVRAICRVAEYAIELPGGGEVEDRTLQAATFGEIGHRVRQVLNARVAARNRSGVGGLDPVDRGSSRHQQTIYRTEMLNRHTYGKQDWYIEKD